MLAILAALQIGAIAPPISIEGSPIDASKGSWVAIAAGITPEAAKNLAELQIADKPLKAFVLGPEDNETRRALGLDGGKKLLLLNPNLRAVRFWESEPSGGFSGALRSWLEGRSLEPGDVAVDPRPFLTESGAIPATEATKGLVIVFLQSDGAVDALYVERLKAAGEAAKKAGIGILGLFPAHDETVESVSAWAEALGFPCAVDPGSAFADAYRATRTPEVFLLDSASKVAYTGSVDSSTWDIDELRPYLLDAIAAMAEGKPIRPAKTFPFGTAIARTPDR
ncbi:MAG: redoxin domain-containing protein [Fimbriimonadales bacterium]|jgi:hypothetical protein|nr:redoxin domain-containing protein [Fimbriimonadales bacterium]